MLSWFPQWDASVLPSNSRVRRWRTRHSREGGTTPPSTRELRTLRELYSTVSARIRGRNVPPRRASVVCEQSATLRTSGAGSLSLRKPAVGTSPPARLLRSSVRLRLVITWPLFLHTSAGVNPARSVPGVQDTAVPAVGAACTHQYQEIGGRPVSTPSAGGVVPGFASSGVPSFQQVSRPGSGPGGRLSPQSRESSFSWQGNLLENDYLCI